MLSSLGVPESQLNLIMTDHHRANISAADVALLDFAIKLGKQAPWISREDILRLYNEYRSGRFERLSELSKRRAS